MIKLENKILIYLGLGLGLSRIIIHLVVSAFKLDSGYFVDVFFFVYLYLWLIIRKHNKARSVLSLIMSNIIISIIAIVVYDLFLLSRRGLSPESFQILNRVTVIVNILLLSLLSSISYYGTRYFIKDKRRTSPPN